jgi:hypothetical protein
MLPVVPVLIKHYALKTYCVMQAHLQTFITLALEGEDHSATCPGRFIPGKRTPGTQRTWDWVDPRAGQDTVARRKIPAPIRNRMPVVNLID